MPVTVVEIPSSYLKIASGAFVISRVRIRSRNAWTQHARGAPPLDERWIVDITMPTETERSRLDEFEAIFDSSEPVDGLYSAFDYTHRVPRGTASGLTDSDSDGIFEAGATWCTVAAPAARGATYLSLTGLVASQSIGFARGDMLSVSQDGSDYGFLHRAAADVATDGSGECSVKIAPALREAVAIGQMVRLREPRGVFRLVDFDFPGVTRGAGGFGQPSLQLVESFESLTCSL